MRRHRNTRRAATVAAVAAGLAAAALLWPAQLGGRVSFLTTVGSSMRPAISEGDFALVRSGPPYRVGDVVAYRNAALGQIALHRIIGEHGERFRLQGDNNDFVDSYEPAQSEIVGRLWVHLPRVGAWLDWLRRPREAAVATVLLGMTMGTGVRQTRKRMRRRRTGEPLRGRAPARASASWTPGPGPRAVWWRLAVAAGALTLAGGAAAAFGAAQPATVEDVELIPYRHAGSFRYEAPAVVGNDVLAGEAMRDGAPVYLRLASTLQVRFDYALEAPALQEASGTHRLRAILTDTRGWEREIELRRPTPFDGGEFTMRGTLNLATLQAMIARFQEQTGIASTNYELRLVAETDVDAVIDGELVRDTFAPELGFTVDSYALQPMPLPEGDSLRPERAGAVQRTVLTPNRLDVLGQTVAVDDLRRTGAAVAGGAGLVLLIALAALSRSPAGRPSERIARRYGGRMLDVQRVEPRPDERLVGMSGIKDLVRIAEGLEAPILHLADGDLHRYIVQDSATTYVVEVDDAVDVADAATVGRLPAPLATPLPAPVAGPASARPLPAGSLPAPRSPRLPPPVVEIDLGEELPPASAGTPPRADGMGLPPAPPRRPR